MITKRRKRKKRVRGMQRVGVAAAVLFLTVFGLNFLRDLSVVNGRTLGGTIRETLFQGEEGAAQKETAAPEKLNETQVRQRLKELAGQYSDYQDIYDRFEEYPIELLSALCNNQEMLDFVKGYLESEKTLPGVFPCWKKRKNTRCFFNGTSVGDMLLSETTILRFRGVRQPVCPWWCWN